MLLRTVEHLGLFHSTAKYATPLGGSTEVARYDVLSPFTEYLFLERLRIEAPTGPVFPAREFKAEQKNSRGLLFSAFDFQAEIWNPYPPSGFCAIHPRS